VTLDVVPARSTDSDGDAREDARAAYRFRAFLPGDERELVPLFNRVFRADPGGEPPRTLAEWEWQFRASPGGFRMWLALHSGRIVAQSAGIGFRVLCDGRETRFAQSVDSLVAPEHRGGLKHPGVFVRTVERYIEAYARNPDLAFFGWPNRAAMRIGARFLGYEIVRQQELLVRTRLHDAGDAPESVRRVLDVDDSVEHLWKRCAVHYGASTIRDAAFLRWRFLAAPGEVQAHRPVGQARELAQERLEVVGDRVVVASRVRDPGRRPGSGAELWIRD
jgi:hypothetical protein